MAIKNKKKLVGNIIFYTLAGLLYAFIIFELVVKFTGGNVYLFGYRFDVVLTDSMSAKNENHLDFLEGTSQIQPFDLVTSKKIKDDTELKIKDVVLFKNPDLNYQTDMHRIVEIYEKGDEVSFINVEQHEINGRKGIKLLDYGSCIATSNLDIKKFNLVFLSNKPYNSNFLLCVGTSFVEPTSHYSSQISAELYKHTMVYERTATYPVKLIINPAILTINSYITNLDIECCETGKKVNVVGEDYVPTVEKTNNKIYNPYYMYETRGDKANDSDGIYARDELISKVVGVTPKLGYFVRFISSVPGMILIIGIALIFTISAYFYNKPPKLKENINAEIIENKAEEKKEKNEKK